MGIETEKYDDSDIEKLKDTFPGLESYFLALVWDFAQFLFRLQMRIDQWERSKRG